MDRGDGLAAELETVRAERDRFREHSITLNTIGWRMAEALGQVPDGAEAVEGNPVEQVEALIAERDAARAIIERVRAAVDELVSPTDLAILRAALDGDVPTAAGPDLARPDPAPTEVGPGRMPRRRQQPRDLGPPIYSDEPAYFCLPDPEPDVWEYAATTGPRKAWADADVPPEGEGWERDVDAGDGGWDRDDYHETSFWRRRVPGGSAEAGEGEVRDGQ